LTMPKAVADVSSMAARHGLFLIVRERGGSTPTTSTF
jgi:hypothetical protein